MHKYAFRQFNQFSFYLFHILLINTGKWIAYFNDEMTSFWSAQQQYDVISVLVH